MRNDDGILRDKIINGIQVKVMCYDDKYKLPNKITTF